MKFIKTKCPECGQVTTHSMSDEQYRQYINNESYIQDIFSDWTPGEREMLMTGICPECWKNLSNYED